MRTILVTNDDGYFSPGIQALAAALAPLGDVIIVAPQTEASAVGHALTLRRPLRCEMVGPNIYAVDGTPTDCVNIAIDEVLAQKPSLVVSGINRGLNVGDDVTYSGTVAGAFEGALLGLSGHCRVDGGQSRVLGDGLHGRRRPSRRRSRRRCSSGRCRRGRFSTSTCRTRR